MTLHDFRHGLSCSVGVVWENLAFSRWWVTPDIVPISHRGVALQVVVLLLIFVLSAADILNYRKSTRETWALIFDLLLLATLSFYMVTFNEEVALSNSYSEFEGSGGEYAGMESQGELQHRYAILETIWVLALYARVLTLAWLGHAYLSMFVIAIRSGLITISSFLVLIVLLQVVLAGATYLFFGVNTEEYSTFAGALLAMVKISLGDLEYQEYKDEGGILG